LIDLRLSVSLLPESWIWIGQRDPEIRATKKR
jgi:hypothetical protein